MNMEKVKEIELDDLAVGVLRCVRRLLELLERCVRTEVGQKKDSSTNTTENGSSTEKGDNIESNATGNKGDNGAGRSDVENELREMLQIMVGTLRRIVEDLKNEDRRQPSPLPSIFDISATSSQKTIPTTGDAPTETTEKTRGKICPFEELPDDDCLEDLINFKDDLDKHLPAPAAETEGSEETPITYESNEHCSESSDVRSHEQVNSKYAENGNAECEIAENENTENENAENENTENTQNENAENENTESENTENENAENENTENENAENENTENENTENENAENENAENENAENENAENENTENETVENENAGNDNTENENNGNVNSENGKTENEKHQIENGETENAENENCENDVAEVEDSENDTGDEEAHGDAGVEEADGGDVDVEDSGDVLSEEGSGDHPPLIEEIDTSAPEARQQESVRPDSDGEDAAASIPLKRETGDDWALDEDWEPPSACERVQSVAALETDEGRITEGEDTADEYCHKDDMGPSDIEYDSYFPTEDEEFSSVPESPSVEEDKPEVLGFSAVHMFRKHMETDNVEVEMFPSPRDQPRRHFFYTCRVLGFEVEACGRSKRAAKRNAISKIIRLMVNKQREGALPEEVSPFTSEEMTALVHAYHGGADYLSRLRQLCCTLQAPPPTYDVQVSEDGDGEKVFTVQCCALGRTAVGICAKKRSAKRHAAREIVKRYEEEAATVKMPTE